MKIEINTNLEPERNQVGIVLGKVLRVEKDNSGVLLLAPDGRFVIVNKRSIKERDSKEVLPALIIATRKHCNLTQAELAKKINAPSRATVVSWEVGHRNPQLITVMAILWICGIVDKWNGIEK